MRQLRRGGPYREFSGDGIHLKVISYREADAGLITFVYSDTAYRTIYKPQYFAGTTYPTGNYSLGVSFGQFRVTLANTKR